MDLAVAGYLNDLDYIEDRFESTSNREERQRSRHGAGLVGNILTRFGNILGTFDP